MYRGSPRARFGSLPNQDFRGLLRPDLSPWRQESGDGDAPKLSWDDSEDWGGPSPACFGCFFDVLDVFLFFVFVSVVSFFKFCLLFRCFSLYFYGGGFWLVVYGLLSTTSR